MEMKGQRGRSHSDELAGEGSSCGGFTEWCELYD